MSLALYDVIAERCWARISLVEPLLKVTPPGRFVCRLADAIYRKTEHRSVWVTNL